MIRLRKFEVEAKHQNSKNQKLILSLLTTLDKCMPAEKFKQKVIGIYERERVDKLRKRK